MQRTEFALKVQGEGDSQGNPADPPGRTTGATDSQGDILLPVWGRRPETPGRIGKVGCAGPPTKTCGRTANSRVVSAWLFSGMLLKGLA